MNNKIQTKEWITETSEGRKVINKYPTLELDYLRNYDSNGNLVYEKIIYNDGSWTSSRREYDERGNVIHTINESSDER